MTIHKLELLPYITLIIGATGGCSEFMWCDPNLGLARVGAAVRSSVSSESP